MAEELLKLYAERQLVTGHSYGAILPGSRSSKTLLNIN